MNYGQQIYGDTVMAHRVSYIEESGPAVGSVEYVGFAAPGTLASATGWRICKLAYDNDGAYTGRTWAGGNANMSKVWDNRATYTYS